MGNKGSYVPQICKSTVWPMFLRAYQNARTPVSLRMKKEVVGGSVKFGFASVLVALETHDMNVPVKPNFRVIEFQLAILLQQYSDIFDNQKVSYGMRGSASNAWKCEKMQKRKHRY